VPNGGRNIQASARVELVAGLERLALNKTKVILAARPDIPLLSEA